jgi:hypothetical protein
MKRLFLLIVLVLVVSWLVASHRSPFRRHDGPTRYWAGAEHRGRAGDARHRRIAVETRPNTLEEAEGLPVPIVPGTRVTEAKASPPAPRSSGPKTTTVTLTQSSRPTVTGLLSATRERAVADARRVLRDDVANWLEPEVPRSWAPPEEMLDAMVVDEPGIHSIQKPYGEVFEATLSVDKSPQRRTSLIAVYHRQLVEQRLLGLGAALAFILICLAAISGYIRADEATKGYYTNRLRMLAAAGVGASGVILYHMLV